MLTGCRVWQVMTGYSLHDDLATGQCVVAQDATHILPVRVRVPQASYPYFHLHGYRERLHKAGVKDDTHEDGVEMLKSAEGLNDKTLRQTDVMLDELECSTDVPYILVPLIHPDRSLPGGRTDQSLPWPSTVEEVISMPFDVEEKVVNGNTNGSVGVDQGAGNGTKAQGPSEMEKLQHLLQIAGAVTVCVRHPSQWRDKLYWPGVGWLLSLAGLLEDQTWLLRIPLSYIVCTTHLQKRHRHGDHYITRKLTLDEDTAPEVFQQRYFSRREITKIEVRVRLKWEDGEFTQADATILRDPEVAKESDEFSTMFTSEIDKEELLRCITDGDHLTTGREAWTHAKAFEHVYPNCSPAVQRNRAKYNFVGPCTAACFVTLLLALVTVWLSTMWFVEVNTEVHEIVASRSCLLIAGLIPACVSILGFLAINMYNIEHMDSYLEPTPGQRLTVFFIACSQLCAFMDFIIGGALVFIHFKGLMKNGVKARVTTPADYERMCGDMTTDQCISMLEYNSFLGSILCFIVGTSTLYAQRLAMRMVAPKHTFFAMQYVLHYCSICFGGPSLLIAAFLYAFVKETTKEGEEDFVPREMLLTCTIVVAAIILGNLSIILRSAFLKSKSDNPCLKTNLRDERWTDPRFHSPITKGYHVFMSSPQLIIIAIVMAVVGIVPLNFVGDVHCHQFMPYMKEHKIDHWFTCTKYVGTTTRYIGGQAQSVYDPTRNQGFTQVSKDTRAEQYDSDGYSSVPDPSGCFVQGPAPGYQA